MLRFTCFALLVTLACGLELKASLKGHWETFKSSNSKSYSSAEESKRKEIFKANVEKVLLHNLNADLGQHNHKTGINEFCDMDHEEFKSTMLGLRYDLVNETENMQTAPRTLSRANVPSSQDWTSYMGPVKNQGQCGSCWTFATTGALEGFYAIHKGQKVVLSEQNLVDCADKSWGNHGCNGGLPSLAMLYIKHNEGIDSDSCYKYEMKVGKCRYDLKCRAAKISNYAKVPYGDEDALLDVVGNKGPVAIGIDAGQPSFQMYKSGIYYDQYCSTRPNHAVVAVGYGTENGEDYWIVKNSWGKSWGDNGYFKMRRGVNLCGISTLASYPVL